MQLDMLVQRLQSNS